MLEIVLIDSRRGMGCGWGKFFFKKVVGKPVGESAGWLWATLYVH